MNDYYRGCLLGDLRGFPAWPRSADADGAELADDTIVYLREDFAVVRSPVGADQGVLWDAQTPQWREFCTAVLGFAPPRDL
jgi:hypothetical protein